MRPEEIPQAVARAAARLRGRVRETPVERSPELERITGARVHLKLENLQHTGSFKLRGALNRVLSLTEAERAAGVVAASTGNHGAAVAYACREVGAPCRVFVPAGASESKLAAIAGYGAEIEVAGADGVVSERTARRFALDSGRCYVSPYNDARVVAGQGTVGAELARQVERIDAIILALGGGGLLAGVAGFLRPLHPELEVVACSARNSAVMFESLAAGEILELESSPTLSDGTAGGVEADAITFPLCRELIDRHALLSEDAIAAALRLMLERQRQLLEGSAALAVAGLLASGGRYRGRSVVVVLCGGNISLETLREVLDPAASPAEGREKTG